MTNQTIEEINKIAVKASGWCGRTYARQLAKLNMHPESDDLHHIIEALIAANELLQYAVEGIKDMAVAHDMSHAPMCDEGYWKGEFRGRTEKLLEMLK